VKYNTKIISKLFQHYISHVTMSETEIKFPAAEGVLKLFSNFISSTLNMFENTDEL